MHLQLQLGIDAPTLDRAATIMGRDTDKCHAWIVFRLYDLHRRNCYATMRFLSLNGMNSLCPGDSVASLERQAHLVDSQMKMCKQIPLAVPAVPAGYQGRPRTWEGVGLLSAN